MYHTLYFRVMTGILPAFKNISKKLSEPSEVYTMFVPSDQAFTYMPIHRSQVLTDPALLESVCISAFDGPHNRNIFTGKNIYFIHPIDFYRCSFDTKPIFCDYLNIQVYLKLQISFIIHIPLS